MLRVPPTEVSGRMDQRVWSYARFSEKSWLPAARSFATPNTLYRKIEVGVGARRA